MSINGLGRFLNVLDQRFRDRGVSEIRIAQMRWDALAPLANAMRVQMPPRPVEKPNDSGGAES